MNIPNLSRNALFVGSLMICGTASPAVAGGGCSAGGHSAAVYYPPATTYRPTATYYPSTSASYSATAYSVPTNAVPTNAAPAYTTQLTATTVPATASAVNSLVDQVATAKASFQAGDYGQAASKLDALLTELPDDANLLQFRSLVYLRSGRNDLAARDAYEAIKHGAIWTAEVIADVYGDSTSHDRDRNMVEFLASQTPDQLAPQFLTAYHNLVAGDWKAGQTSLQAVLDISPSEPIATALLKVLDVKLGADNKLATAKTR